MYMYPLSNRARRRTRNHVLKPSPKKSNFLYSSSDVPGRHERLGEMMSTSRLQKIQFPVPLRRRRDTEHCQKPKARRTKSRTARASVPVPLFAKQKPNERLHIPGARKVMSRFQGENSAKQLAAPARLHLLHPKERKKTWTETALAARALKDTAWSIRCSPVPRACVGVCVCWCVCVLVCWCVCSS